MGVNFIAVVVAAITSMVIGSLWYSPLLFGKLWMRLQGISKKDIVKAKQKSMEKLYFWAFIGALVTAGVFAYLLDMFGKSAEMGITLSLLIWLGFVATTMLGTVLWEGKSVSLYALNVFYHFVNLVVMGVIIGMW